MIVEVINKVKAKYLLRNLFFLAAGLLFFSSCEKQVNESNLPKTYFDIKGFVESQIKVLSEQRPEVLKQMRIAGESSQAKTRDIDWKKELELFIQSDINKPAFRQSYTINRPDSLSYYYVLKKEYDLPVQHLTIRLDSTDKSPRHIDAFIKTENKLYKSEKTINLNLEPLGKLTRITNYRIEGFQKLAIMDKKDFRVEGKLTYK